MTQTLWITYYIFYNWLLDCSLWTDRSRVARNYMRTVSMIGLVGILLSSN